ncbi:interleukin-15 isoform X2 [Salminus brasiliensis]|uniref:interleukin-15 isoform X2 n=1 Tax=Salminus brasiliensis TaxID=930266 RepID=UPI003B833C49
MVLKGTVRCVSLHWCFDSNLEYHLNTEVWNSFLILSCLGVFWTTVDAHATASLEEIRDVLQEMKHIFDKSDARLYAPEDNNNLQDCSSKLLYCYLLELYVIANEEGADPNNIHIIFTNKKKYETCAQITDLKISKCPECETFPVVNSTVFLKMMGEFLQKLPLSNDCN